MAATATNEAPPAHSAEAGSSATASEPSPATRVLCCIDTASEIFTHLDRVVDVAALRCALDSEELRSASVPRCKGLLRVHGAVPLAHYGGRTAGVVGLLEACVAGTDGECPAAMESLAELWSGHRGQPELADSWWSRSTLCGGPRAQLRDLLHTLAGYIAHRLQPLYAVYSADVAMAFMELRDQVRESILRLARLATDGGVAELWRATAHLYLAWAQPLLALIWPPPLPFVTAYEYPSPLPQDQRSWGPVEDKMIHHLEEALRLAKVSMRRLTVDGAASQCRFDEVGPPREHTLAVILSCGAETIVAAAASAAPRVWPEWASEAEGVLARAQMGLQRAFTGPMHTRSTCTGAGWALWAAETTPLHELLKADGAQRMTAGQVHASVELRCAGWPQEARREIRDGMVALHLAARYRHTTAGTVAAVLRAWPEAMDVGDRDGWTPLHIACRSGHNVAVRELCEASSREAARRGCLTAPDRHGGQPLHAAAYKGHAEAVRLLLSHRADAHAADARGLRPMHWAADKGHADAVRQLLAAPTLFVPATMVTSLSADQRASDVDLPTVTAIPGYPPSFPLSTSDERASGGSGSNGDGAACNRVAAAATAATASSSPPPPRSTPPPLVDGDAARNTPLHLAAANGDLPTVELLLRLGAPVSALNAAGETPRSRVPERCGAVRDALERAELAAPAE